eukprot:sb/3470679/
MVTMVTFDLFPKQFSNLQPPPHPTETQHPPYVSNWEWGTVKGMTVYDKKTQKLCGSIEWSVEFENEDTTTQLTLEKGGQWLNVSQNTETKIAEFKMEKTCSLYGLQFGMLFNKSMNLITKEYATLIIVSFSTISCVTLPKSVDSGVVLELFGCILACLGVFRVVLFLFQLVNWVQRLPYIVGTNRYWLADNQSRDLNNEF